MFFISPSGGMFNVSVASGKGHYLHAAKNAIHF